MSTRRVSDFSAVDGRFSAFTECSDRESDVAGQQSGERGWREKARTVDPLASHWADSDLAAELTAIGVAPEDAASLERRVRILAASCACGSITLARADVLTRALIYAAMTRLLGRAA